MGQITLRDYLQETEDAISSGRLDDALTSCQHILTLFPESLEAQRLLGEVYLAQGHLENAQQTFDWVLTNDPENIITYCDRALISERNSDYETALDCYQQAYELSRGNSQIRREFNQLSTRVGQQGFMFSRAGLARLYMRGDLMTQAIQEWEAVLTTAPERLDARVGLLEVLWREGLYDRVESVATDILQDVPGCLKALLLLAHVSSPKNIQQTRDLLQRAEMLDPDMIMAQDLFADMNASVPSDPFLQLLKRPPVSLDTLSQAGSAGPVSQPGIKEHAPQVNSPAPLSGEWSNLDIWNKETIFTLPQPEIASDQQTDIPIWSSTSMPQVETWNGNGTDKQPSQPGFDAPHFSSQPGILPLEEKETLHQPIIQDNVSFEPWQQEIQPPSDIPEAPSAEPPAWGSFDQFSDTNIAAQNPFANMETWENIGEIDSEEATTNWGSSRQAEQSAPPAWLNMLTQGERRQMSGEMTPIPSTSFGQEETQIAQPPAAAQPEPQAQDEPTLDAFSAWNELPFNTGSSDDDEEPLSFGPEWLKSLGATAIDNQIAEEAPPVEPVQPVLPTYQEPQAIQAPEASYNSWNEPLSAPVEQAPLYNSWEEPLPVPAEKPAEKAPDPGFSSWTEQLSALSEPNLLKTMEDLEKGLRSQGFIQMEPNSLANIAHSAETYPGAPEMVDTQQPLASEPFQMQQEQDLRHEPSLSAALAELGLGNFMAPAHTEPEPSTIEPLSLVEPASQQEQLWAAALNALSPTREEPTPPTVQAPAPNVPSWLQEYQAIPQVPEQAPVMSGPLPAFQPFEATPQPEQIAAEQINIPVARVDPLLDSELETTMKRPAVRLQPMRQRPTGQRDQKETSAFAPPQPKERVSTERSAIGKAPEHNLSNRERLLRGYQYQLLGDYDDAMQEYRIVIRSASPELLGEVVSNVRALLKIAPRYSAGYRVLGDAYMRQGEYLQAMEAYNKALTMAKKAKA